MAAARVGGSTQMQIAAISSAPLVKPLLIARDGGAAEDDDRAAAADLKQIEFLTESIATGAAALGDGESPAPGSFVALVIRLGQWAAGNLDRHGADDDGLPAGPALASVDQRARTMRRVGPSEGAIS